MSLVISSAVATLFASAPLAHAGGLPSGGHFVAGSGSINGNATSLTVNQNSSRGVIDWNSFSISSGNHVSINNGSGATLNRVTGGTFSSILGRLLGTGSVYLINPQGVVVGSSGVVTTGGRFVASTLNTSNASFMSGGPLTLTGTSKAWVVNLGAIGSSHGDVFLVAADRVENLGSIHAPNGTAELAAGQRVLLKDSSTGQQVFVQLGSKGTVLNRGTIDAAQISLQAADGNVFALSGNHEAIRATGTAKRGGHVWLVAGNGTVEIAANVQAKNANGSGGTVDTIAHNLVLCNTIPAVLAGVWNITVPSFTVGSLAAQSFSRSLSDGTSINLQAIGPSGSGQTGDINVASNIGWTGAASLALDAYHSVNISSGVTLKNQGSGNLTLRADSRAIDNGSHVTNLGTIDWSGSTGLVRAFYDSSAVGGGYTPGAQFSNPAWTPGPGSGVLKQITAYQLVNTLADLQAMNSNLTGNYALGRDIDASATSNGSYVPIGNQTTSFWGLFDGMGHHITSLSLLLTTNNPIEALFGEIGRGALVRDVSVNGTSQSGSFLGGVLALLAGINYGTIENVSTSGSLVGPYGGAEVAGLVGENDGTILDSSSSASISSGGLAGGLVGNNVGNVARSYATGTVDTFALGTAGGLAGTNSGSISRSYATGDVGAAYEADAGGLVGNNFINGTISQSYATGAVSGGGIFGAGGLAGENGGQISQSYATGAVSVIEGFNAGGLVGNNNAEGSIAQSFATGLITFDPHGGTSVPGGIAGYNDHSAIISADSYWNAQTTGVAVSAGSNAGNAPVPPPSHGLTTAQMSMPSSFVGWNFGPNGVWAMPAGSSHPVLAWQLAP